MHSDMNKRAVTFPLTVLAAAALSACVVGPDFVRPAAPTTSAYDNAQAPAAVPPAKVKVAPSAIAIGRDLPAQWWDMFQAPALPGLLDQAIGANQTLVAARATLEQAKETIVQARSGWFPAVSLGGSAGKSIVGNGTNQYFYGPATTVTTQYQLGPSISYTFDLFGQTARTVEQARANAENQQYQLAAAYLTLTSSAVTQAITYAMTQKLLATTEDLIKNDEKNLDLVQKSFRIGTAARTDVLTAQTQLESDRTQLPALHQQLAVARHALAVLVGQPPSEWQTPEIDFDSFQMPGELPVALPSELVRQRPDILSAEALLHADSAAIGIAEANIYPNISLSTSLDYQASQLNQLFKSGTRLLSTEVDANWTLYEGGALDSAKRGAIDAYQAQLATYKQTVLTAFGQVADALRAVDNDTEALRLAQNSLDISTESLRLQRLTYEVGRANVLQLITAENSYAQARMNAVRVQGQRLQDCVTLFVAVGGGWQKKDGLTDKSVLK